LHISIRRRPLQAENIPLSLSRAPSFILSYLWSISTRPLEAHHFGPHPSHNAKTKNCCHTPASDKPHRRRHHRAHQITKIFHCSFEDFVDFSFSQSENLRSDPFTSHFDKMPVRFTLQVLTAFRMVKFERFSFIQRHLPPFEPA